MLIGDDELDAVETALSELRQQCSPGGLALLGPDGDAQEMSMAVVADGLG